MKSSYFNGVLVFPKYLVFPWPALYQDNDEKVGIPNSEFSFLINEPFSIYGLEYPLVPTLSNTSFWELTISI